MPRPVEDLRIALAADEPDYLAISLTLDSGDAQGLDEIARGDDRSLAVKAVYLAGMLPDDAGADVVQNAAGSGNVLLRVSAATAARHLTADPSALVLGKLLTDGDDGVRKTAIASIPASGHNALLAPLREMAGTDPVPSLADAARQLADASEQTG